MALRFDIQLRLAWYARWLLIIASVCRCIGIRIPHAWVVAVTNRSWRMRTGAGNWQAIRIDSTGRLVR